MPHVRGQEAKKMMMAMKKMRMKTKLAFRRPHGETRP